MSKQLRKFASMTQRADDLISRHPDWKLDYGSYDSAGNVKAILCFSCGTEIVNEVEVDRRRVSSGIREILVRLLPNASFAKVNLKLNTGAEMSPMLCKSCVSGFKLDISNDALFRDDVMTAMVGGHVHSALRSKKGQKEQKQLVDELKDLEIVGLA